MSAEVKRIADLMGQLASPLPAERDAALVALVDFAHHPDVRKIFANRAEQDPDPDVRFHARQIHSTVGTVFQPKPAPEIVEFVRNFRQTSQFDASALKVLMKSEVPAVRLQATLATVQMKQEGLIDHVIPFLKVESDPWVLAAIITAVGVLGNAAHLHHVLPFLRSDSPRVVANAIAAVYALAPEEAFQRASPLLNHSDNRVQGNVLMILAERDPEKCRNHLRLMATSRKEAYRSTAIHCLKLMDAAFASELAMEMFLQEDVGSLAEKEAELLAKVASETAVPALVQLAGKRTDREPQVRFVLIALSGRFQWPPEVLDRHLQRIAELAREPAAVVPPSARPQVTRRLHALREEVEAKQNRSASRWVAVGTLGAVLLCGFVGWRVAASPQLASTISVRPSAQSQPPKIGSSNASQAKGTPLSVTGVVTSARGENVLVKAKYVYYAIEYPDNKATRAVQAGQSVHVAGIYEGWDEVAGVVRMKGTSIAPKGGRGGS